MNYISTRSAYCVSPSDAVLMGIAPDGGLFVPENFIDVKDELQVWKNLRYEELAARVLSLYFTDFTAKELLSYTQAAYTGQFPAEIVPVKNIYGDVFMMELFCGPTLAFKDMALQVLPHLMGAAMQKTGVEKDILILVATSGDTGKAALEGFCDVERTAIAVFYPQDGVSAAQRLQMVAQQGDNVHVCAVNGNFDDAQTGVKEIFTDEAFVKQIDEKGYRFSSANSINWGRLSPQITYYFWTYFKMAQQGSISFGDAVNIVVPTGNFGNILAAYYAKRMGLPVHKLICASNRNNVLTDFFQTGRYDVHRTFYRTASPSMDILISSNLERLLFELCGRDTERLEHMMLGLKEKGTLDMDEAMKQRVDSLFYAGFLDDEATKAEIGSVYHAQGYLMDTHTAVAHGVYRQYVHACGDETPTMIAATASPFKFAPHVLSAIGEAVPKDELQSYRLLSKATGLPLPAQISQLETAAVRHRAYCEKDGMRADLLRWIDASAGK
ncbi:MAG: threonine synthase [Christensenellales bacterium]|jgi:threonine synthase